MRVQRVWRLRILRESRDVLQVLVMDGRQRRRRRIRLRGRLHYHITIGRGRVRVALGRRGLAAAADVTADKHREPRDKKGNADGVGFLLDVLCVYVCVCVCVCVRARARVHIYVHA